MAASFITSTIVFTPGNANVGTLQFSGISGFNVKRLKFAINLTRGVILFAPTVADYYAVSGDTLTLSVNTSTHANTDVIQAVYDYGFTGTDTIGSGTLNSATNNAAYTLTLGQGEGTVSFAVTGLTASGATLTIEASDDSGTTWSSINGIAPATGALFTTLTTDQQFRVNSGGRTKIRLRVSSTGSGTITIASNQSIASSAVTLSSPLPTGTNTIGKIGMQVSGSDVASNNPVPITVANSTTTLPVSIASGNTSVAKAEDVASADADVGIPAMAIRKATPTNTSSTDGDYEMLQMNNGALWTSPLGYFVTCSTDITRPADTTAYAANDALSNSTSAPTSGGFTFTSAARKSGGSGIITDAWIGSTAPTGSMQGEIWIFDQAVTNVNDNAAFAITDAENKTVVGMIPFTTVAGTNNAGVHVPNLGIGFTCVGSADLRFLVKIKAAYTPQSAEVITVRIKCMQID